MYSGFTSDGLELSQITDCLERVINPQLYAIDSVTSIILYGGMKYALRVWLGPGKLAALNLTATDVNSVLSDNNYQSATGQALGEFALYNGSADIQVSNAEHLKRWGSKTDNGNRTRLGKNATVTLTRRQQTYRATAYVQ
ncbi:hypothetical protein UF06_00030, partial [Vibrio sp. S234-5]